MSEKEIKGSLFGIVDKLNQTYDGLIGNGFSPGVDRRVVPVMRDGSVSGWKMQSLEDGAWVDLDETPFATMEELIEFYKSENR